MGYGDDRREAGFIPGQFALCEEYRHRRAGLAGVTPRRSSMTLDRRQFLKLSALGGGAVFASSLPGCAAMGRGAETDFYFVQLSDTHWGFNGPAVNPDARGTLPKAVAAGDPARTPPAVNRFPGVVHPQ